MRPAALRRLVDAHHRPQIVEIDGPRWRADIARVARRCVDIEMARWHRHAEVFGAPFPTLANVE